MTANEWAAIAVAVGTLTGFLVTGVRFLVKSYYLNLNLMGEIRFVIALIALQIRLKDWKFGLMKFTDC